MSKSKNDPLSWERGRLVRTEREARIRLRDVGSRKTIAWCARCADGTSALPAKKEAPFTNGYPHPAMLDIFASAPRWHLATEQFDRAHQCGRPGECRT